MWVEGCYTLEINRTAVNLIQLFSVLVAFGLCKFSTASDELVYRVLIAHSAYLKDCAISDFCLLRYLRGGG